MGELRAYEVSYVESLIAEREVRIDKWMELIEEKDKRIAKLEAVAEAAKKCDKGCRRCNSIDDRYTNLRKAIAAAEKENDECRHGEPDNGIECYTCQAVALLENETESHKMTLNRESILTARIKVLEAVLVAAKESRRDYCQCDECKVMHKTIAAADKEVSDE